MSREEFETKWLTVGTESKTDGSETNEKDRNGLPIRAKQGQKGMGAYPAQHLARFYY
ncbi:hypothetical protein ACVXG7_10610 [Enterobacter hormaechei]